MHEARCKKCNKLLFRYGKKFIDFTGVPPDIREQVEKQFGETTTIEIKCDRCKEINQIKL